MNRYQHQMDKMKKFNYCSCATFVAIIFIISHNCVQSQIRMPPQIFVGKNILYILYQIKLPPQKLSFVFCIYVTGIHLLLSILGAVFQEGDSSAPLQQAFKHGIDMVNDDRTILGNSRLIPRIEVITASNSFKASKKGKMVSQKKIFLCVFSFSRVKKNIFQYNIPPMYSLVKLHVAMTPFIL